MKNTSGFVAGTLVHVKDHEDGYKPIQDIKVGNMVLSKPKDGTGEPTYKPVLKTFVHQDKEIWMVKANRIAKLVNKNNEEIDYFTFKRASRYEEFLATPNHLVWVVGVENGNEIDFYDEPYWKRVDELIVNDVLVNQHGVMYGIQRAQPVYEFDAEHMQTKPSYYWYAENHHNSFADYYAKLHDGTYKPDFEVTKEELEQKYIAEGRVLDLIEYIDSGYGSDFMLNDYNMLPEENTRKVNGAYVPFTTTVYNLEVADNHTYFIRGTGIWVRQ